MVQGRAVCAGFPAGHFTPTEVVNAHIYPEVLLLVLLLLHLLCKTVMAVVVPLSIILTSQEGNRLRERSKLSKFLGLCTGVNFTNDVGPPDTLGGARRPGCESWPRSSADKQGIGKKNQPETKQSLSALPPFR